MCKLWLCAVVMATAVLLAVAGCGDGNSNGDAGDGDADGDGDSDADGDADGDSDGDAHADADSDGDQDGETGPLRLEVGDVVDLLPHDGALRLAIEVDGGEKLLAIVHSPPFDLRKMATYEVEVSTTAAIRPKPAGKGLISSIPDAGSRRPDMSVLPSVLQSWRDGLTRPVQRAPDPPPTMGEIRSFWVSGDNRYVEIDAEAVYVSTQVAFWLDQTSEPPAEIDPDDLQTIAAEFEQIVLPREHRFFGQESDVNEDSIIFVVMSEVVHENDGPVAYFSPCDLLQPGAIGCQETNEAEIIYLTPPNAIHPPMNTARAILETMAHETNHLIFMNTRYLQHGGDGNVENMYLLEGVAALAQDLTGYQAGNLYVAWYGLNEILDFSALDALDDYGRYDLQRDGCLRGGAYLLMRYLYDRAGGDTAQNDGSFEDLGGIAFIQAFHNTDTAGLEGLEEHLDAPLEEVLFDFYTALAVTNRGEEHGPIADEPQYNYLPTVEDPVTGRQRGFDAYASLHMGAMEGPATVPLPAADGEMRPAGVEIVEIDAEQAGPLVVTVRAPEETATVARLARIE